MSKPYIPTFDIIIRRSFDGKVEGERSWKLTAAGSYIDKLEDAIAFVADSAMDAYGLRTAASAQETPSAPMCGFCQLIPCVCVSAPNRRDE